MPKFTFLFLFLTIISLGNSTLKAQAPAQCQDVMLQAFYWDSYSDSKWTTLNAEAAEIASNFSLVWLPPSGNVQSSNNMGYFPIYWFDQNSAFGSAAELKTLIATLKSKNVKTIADVVINHRSGVSSWTDFPSETYNGTTYSLGPAQICSDDEVKDAAGQPKPTGAPDTGEGFNGSRDLDHTSTVVRNAIKAYMQFLKNDMGYAGWRYDFTKGYAASYVNEYNVAAGASFSVGEYFDGNYDLVKAWINGCSNNSTSFDFPLKFQLNKAMSSSATDLTQLVWFNQSTQQNQPAGLIHHADTKRYAVTFVDNHDTYNDINNKYTGNIPAAYAFLMSSPGVPCILLRHWLDYKGEINAMIAARRAVQLHSESDVTVNQTAANSYVATATGKNGSLIVKIGSGSYTIPVGYTLAASGTGYAMYTKVINPVAPPLTVSPGGGIYFSAQNVVMSSSAAASIYYTTNNTAPTTASTLYSAPIPVSASQTIRAIAYDPATQLYSAEASNTYTISTIPASLKLRFKIPSGWTACNLYSWLPGTTTTYTAAWPGSAMILEPDGYYSYTLTGFASLPVGVVFNNGTGSSQTVDLSASGDMCWDAGALSGIKYTATEVVCLPTGTGDLKNDTFSVYPNPANDNISITIPEGYIQVNVFSALGQPVPVKPVFSGNLCQLNLSACPTGIYFISLHNLAGKQIIQKIMKY